MATGYKITFKNEDVYVGETHRELPWVEGKYTFANGDVCKGGIYHKDGSSSGHVTATTVGGIRTASRYN